jgi:hypothetical protein
LHEDAGGVPHQFGQQAERYHLPQLFFVRADVKACLLAARSALGPNRTTNRLCSRRAQFIRINGRQLDAVIQSWIYAAAAEIR